MKIKSGSVSQQDRRAFRGAALFRETKQGLVAQSWPKKRGPATSGPEYIKQQLFKQAAQITPYLDPMQRVTAEWMAHGSEQVWRDVAISAIYGNLILIEDQSGGVWTSARSTLTARRKRMGIVTKAIFSADKTAQNYSTEAAIQWDGVAYDTGPWWSALNKDRITIGSGTTVIDAELYIASGLVSSNVEILGRVEVRSSAGAVKILKSFVTHSNPGTFRFFSVPLLHYPVVAGDYVRAIVWCGDNSITLYGGAGNCALTVRQVRGS